MQDFPANSRTARTTEPREKIEPVTSAEAVRRKRGLGRQFRETFFAGDSARGAAEYVFLGVIIPAIKDLLFDAMMEGGQRMIYGESARSRRPMGSSFGGPNVGQVNYAGMNPGAKKPAQRMLSRQSRARHDFNDLVISSSQEANDVLDRMYDLLSRYGSVSVADLYELTGIQSAHTDMKWGWTNLRGAKAVRLRQGGFLLDLPDPEALG